MSALTQQTFSKTIYLLIASSGFVTLAWEVIWQIKSTLALGISAWGTALTLAVMMGGMCLGGFFMGQRIQRKSPTSAIRLYGCLEILAGLSGLLLNSAFLALEKIDTWAYTQTPASISLVYIIGIIAILSLPTVCMGATLPVFGLIAKQFELPIAKIYSLNTLGAASSVLIVAFILIPLLGINHTIWMIAAANLLIGGAAWLIVPNRGIASVQQLNSTEVAFQIDSSKKIFLIFVTGFATFTLEVAWFRAFANVFSNTTDIFAIMLACMLIALGLAAKDISKLKQKNKLLGTQICIAAVLIFLITPLIERLDYLSAYYKQMQMMATHLPTANIKLFVAPNYDWLINPVSFNINWFAALRYICQIFVSFCWIFILIVPPVRFLGRAFPWVLDDLRSPHFVGKIYAINTLAAIIGSIGTAWLLLPTIGFAKTAWIAGALVLLAGIFLVPTLKRIFWATIGTIALLIAMHFETGIGQTRVQGYFATDNQGHPARLLEFFEGPAETISVVEYNDKSRALLINNTAASWESGNTYRPSIHYMAWMGHLPMLLHAAPKKALVICFGTGQTANAIRKENPEELDIVDVNPNVFKLAHQFRSNEGVLNDPRVKTIGMDGRAYLRRTNKTYDIITLEPMPPNANGVNALYSREFYQLASKRLGANGIIAQWLPFHVVAPHYTASIAKTFIDVFPNAILWLDQASKTGILIGSKDTHTPLASSWPGFARVSINRDLSPEKVQQYIALNSNELKEYSKYGQIISDDNQLLAYGKALYASGLLQENYSLLRHINPSIKIPQIERDFQ